MKRALLIGYAVHARAVKHLVNANSSNWRVISAGPSVRARNRALFQLPFVDVVVSLGGPNPDALVAACARRLRIPVGVIWAGTDVARIERGYDATARVRARRYRQAACAANIQKELSDLGIAADEVPIVAAEPVEKPAALPATFTVLAYGARNNEYLYGLDILLAAAERFPSMQFIVLGTMAHDRKAPSNVKFAGWDRNVAARLDESTVLLRPTRHDGLSRMVIEALARGRHAIWSEPLRGARLAKDAGEVLQHLGELYAAHERGALHVNTDGIACVREHYAPPKICGKIEAFFDGVAQTTPRGKRRAVVSGSSQRVAAFVEAAAASMPDWDFHAAISGSRAERLDDVISLIAAERWYRLGDRREDSLFRAAARIFLKRRYHKRGYARASP